MLQRDELATAKGRASHSVQNQSTLILQARDDCYNASKRCVVRPNQSQETNLRRASDPPNDPNAVRLAPTIKTPAMLILSAIHGLSRLCVCSRRFVRTERARENDELSDDGTGALTSIAAGFCLTAYFLVSRRLGQSPSSVPANKLQQPPGGLFRNLGRKVE